MSAPTLLTFGDYLLYRKLGEGGMGSVYLAHRRGDPGLCVVKQLRPGLPEVAARRMRREAEVGAHLRHPNIVAVRDAGSVQGTFYIAVDLVVGYDLTTLDARARAQGRPLDLRIILRIVLDALSGLDYAHRARGPDGAPLAVVHRDLSGNNVMIGADGRARLIDFGLVRADLGALETQPGMLLGTLRYLSPEQAVAAPVDGRSDLYMLSVVLHELITGEVSVPAESIPDILAAIVTKPLRSLSDDVPPRVAAAIARGLAKDADDRFATAGAYAAALSDAVGGDVATPEEVGALVRSLFPELELLEQEVETLGTTPPLGEVTVAVDPEAPAPELADLPDPRWAATRAVSAAELSQSALQPESRTRRPLFVLLGLTTVLAGLATAVVLMQPDAPAPTRAVSTPAPAVRVQPKVRAAETPEPPAPPPEVAPSPRPTAPPTRRGAIRPAPMTTSEKVQAASPPPAPSMSSQLDALTQRARRLERATRDERANALLAELLLLRASGRLEPHADRIRALSARLTELETELSR